VIPGATLHVSVEVWVFPPRAAPAAAPLEADAAPLAARAADDLADPEPVDDVAAVPDFGAVVAADEWVEPDDPCEPPLVHEPEAPVLWCVAGRVVVVVDVVVVELDVVVVAGRVVVVVDVVVVVGAVVVVVGGVHELPVELDECVEPPVAPVFEPVVPVLEPVARREAVVWTFALEPLPELLPDDEAPDDAPLDEEPLDDAVLDGTA
jgi:hypothetical protein